MKTPIYDFLKTYAASGTSRFHMPGHKGKSFLGCEALDITEIGGADVLSSADGIIAESEKNASALFGSAATFYSTEGSTLAIKAMLAIARDKAKNPTRATILAARNVHKAFINAAALLDLHVEWLYGRSEHLCLCEITAEDVEAKLSKMAEKPFAVYLTSPDYLGATADISAISEVCKKFSVPLLVDNAHGAYTAFLSPSRHPIALGADMCCDSAHKTLPVLTGGAYLHVSRNADPYFIEAARARIALFASTSPSYLILASLDLCNKYLSENYANALLGCVAALDKTRRELSSLGFVPEETEPLKLVVKTSKYGYTGAEVANSLRSFKVEVEYYDTEYVVLMASPENTEEDYLRIAEAFSSLTVKETLESPASLALSPSVSKMSIREAIFSEVETVSARLAAGRIAASPTVSCPPAVPIVISGEQIRQQDVLLFEKYGIETVSVVKNK